jgi:hypothetical protein
MAKKLKEPKPLPAPPVDLNQSVDAAFPRPDGPDGPAPAESAGDGPKRTCVADDRTRGMFYKR